MSEKSLFAKIDFILEMIENIELIISRHKGIVETLEDFEGQMAVLMGISQITRKNYFTMVINTCRTRNNNLSAIFKINCRTSFKTNTIFIRRI